MSKKYYIWIALGVFIIMASVLLAMNSGFFRGEEPVIPEPVNNSSFSLSEESVLPEDEAVVEINMENSDVDFEADIDDFESDLESMEGFDEDIDLESIDDAELL